MATQDLSETSPAISVDRSQAAGRGGIFADYRLRIASVVRDYGMTERDQAPADSRETHDRRAPVGPI